METPSDTAEAAAAVTRSVAARAVRSATFPSERQTPPLARRRGESGRAGLVSLVARWRSRLRWRNQRPSRPRSALPAASLWVGQPPRPAGRRFRIQARADEGERVEVDRRPGSTTAANHDIPDISSCTCNTRELAEGSGRPEGSRTGGRQAPQDSQFLVESLVLSGIGGLLGIAAGVGGARLVTMVGKWQTTVAGSAIALAFGVAMAIGVFFGLYPAHKASKLDPIEALRHE
jgi:hypothetical protein